MVAVKRGNRWALIPEAPPAWKSSPNATSLEEDD